MNIEVQHVEGGMTDSERMRLATYLLDNYISKPDGMNQDAATGYLYHLGFEVEWMINSDGDILLCLLWSYGPDPEHKLLDEFIIEFAGHDASIVSLFCLTESTQL